MLLSDKSIRYLPTIIQLLNKLIKNGVNIQIALPTDTGWEELHHILNASSDAKIEIKQSYWVDGSYVIRDRTVMMNIMHSKDDVAMVTNDDLLVSNIRACWQNTSCCSPDLVELELNQ